MNSEELLSQIEKAFGDLSKPEKNEIASDTSGYHLECNQVAEYFAGKAWREITAQLLWSEYIGDGSACLSFMSPQAFVYYLPTYMTIAINEYEHADVIADSAIYALTPEKEEDLKDWWKERISVLNSKQIICIISFTKYMLENHEDDYLEDSLNETHRFWVDYWNTNMRERIRKIEEKAMRKLNKQKDHDNDNE